MNRLSVLPEYLGLSFTAVLLVMALSYSQTPLGSPGEDFTVATDDGAWCWYGDPRALYYEGEHKKTYTGWVERMGSIVAWSYDHETGEMDTAVIHENYHRDDHDNPIFYVKKDGRIMVFYQKHGGEKFLRRFVTTNPEDISQWDAMDNIATNQGATYAHMFRLSEENDRVYLFTRALEWHPTLLTSDDDGDTWSSPVLLVEGGGGRPYMKYVSDGKSRIHFAFTDGHPRNESTNSIYYMYYENGAYYKAGGVKIKDTPPITHPEVDLIYDGSTKGRAWIWDIALDSAGHPVIVHSVCPQETDHRYYYARWNGQEWRDEEMTPAGKWFPETAAGQTEKEPHYSGGVVLDHHNPSIVYLSKPTDGVFEIERWETDDGGETWDSLKITSGSQNLNVRPFGNWAFPFGSKPAQKMLMWMNGGYVHYTNFTTGIRYWIEKAGCPDSNYREYDSTRNVDDFTLCQTLHTGSPAEFDLFSMSQIGKTIVFNWGAKAYRKADIIDLQGKTVSSYSVAGTDRLTVSTEHYTPGMYILVLRMNGNRMERKFLIFL